MPSPRVFARPGIAVAADPVHTYGFLILQAYLFLLTSRVSEFLDPHHLFHLALITASAAALCTILNLRFRNAFDNKIGLALAAFTVWAIAEIPFSSWRGGSFHGLMDSWLKSYMTFIIVAALIGSLAQLRKALACIALGSAVIVFLSFKFGISSEADNRFSFKEGSLGNSNDLAMELILGLPFILYVATDKKRFIAMRIAAWLAVPVLLYVVLKTGSRAGLLALIAMGVLLFLRTTAMNRLRIGALALVLAAIAPFMLSRDLRARYSTIVSGNHGVAGTKEAEVVESAEESQESRVELIQDALYLTAHHPIFGVGMDQFGAAVADLALAQGKVAFWHPVHSFLLLVMAETGVPGVVLYTAALIYCLSTVIRVVKFTRTKDLGAARHASEALLYSLTGFLTCMLFSPSAYLYHFPLMAGLVTALLHSVRSQMIIEPPSVNPALTPGSRRMAATLPRAWSL